MLWRASRCKTGLVRRDDEPARKLPAMVRNGASDVFETMSLPKWAKFFPVIFSGQFTRKFSVHKIHKFQSPCSLSTLQFCFGFIPHFKGDQTPPGLQKKSLTWKIVTPIQFPFPVMCSLGTQSRCLAAAGRGGPPSPARKDHLESFMQQVPDWESLCEHKWVCLKMGYTPNEIAIFRRDNDQQNHWVQWGTLFSDKPKSIKFIRSPTSMLFQQVTWICKRINNLLDPQNGPQHKCKIVKVFQTRTKSLKKSKNRI